MRRYTDPDGGAWDVVIGRESFGALYALFVPARGNRQETRQTLLQAESQAEASEELEAMTADALDALFSRSEPKRLE